jgi:LysR family transcriptional regulator, nitrogen assimilation regulatory protein
VLAPELFARMRRDYPMIELKIMHAGMVRLEEFVIDGRVDIALLSELSRSRLIVSTRLAEEEMVLVTRPGARPAGAVSGDELRATPLILGAARPAGAVSGDELRATPLILGDGLRAAMDALLAGLGIELTVDTELNDHETIRLMVQQGAGAAVLPLSSVSKECARGLIEAHRITENGVFRTLALGVRASRNASLARDAVARTIRAMIDEMDRERRLAMELKRPAPRRRAAVG